MNEFSTVLNAVLPVFAAMLAGGLMRKWNVLTEDADNSLMRMTLNLLVPSLIFDSILQNEALKQPENLLLAPLVGFITVAVGLWVAKLLGGLSGLKNVKALRAFIICVGIYNYGYMTLPLADQLYDRKTVGVLFVHNLGVEIAMWTLGVMVLTGGKSGGGKSGLWNAPVISILIAVFLNLIGAYQYIPNFVMSTAHFFGQCAFPIALILTGAIVADYAHEFHEDLGGRVITSSVLLRILLIPFLFMLAARYLPSSIVSLELKRVIVLQATMPAAIFPIVLVKRYDCDTPTALRVVLGTLIISLFTIPLWLKFGKAFAGL
ncbi:MAG TPA: AEC family transporter [Roseimicrobium sp.]|nr:AEC family transporter [Roseimicrobium sp.]